MNHEITIVTAFFDIGRGSRESQTRSAETYLDYFKKWARIQNNIIVFTESRFSEEILNIRKSYGLAEKTNIQIVEDIYSIEPDIFRKMEEISGNKCFKQSRYYVDDISNEGKYNYIMMMKNWCLATAVKKYHLTGTVAWLDFGYGHGVSYFANEEDWNFNWSYQDMPSKIVLFSRIDVTHISSFEYLMLQSDAIMGGLYLVPTEHCQELYELTKQSMLSLILLDYMDDDQQLLLMAVRTKPELFDVRVSQDWYTPMTKCGGEHFRLSDKKQQKSLKNKIAPFYRIVIRPIYRKISRPPNTPENFSHRMYQIAKKHYVPTKKQ